VFGDGDMAAAAGDRVIHHGRIVRFQGESYRSTHSLMNNQTEQHDDGNRANRANHAPTLLNSDAFHAQLDMVIHRKE
jgi:hypothetical protein